MLRQEEGSTGQFCHSSNVRTSNDAGNDVQPIMCQANHVPEGPKIVKIVGARNGGEEVKVMFESGVVGWRNLTEIRRSGDAVAS